MDISDRVRAVVDREVPEKKRTQTLEAATGVAAETWRMFLTKRQKATEKIIESVCQAWPQYAFWIGTGITDSARGHVGPDIAYDGVINRKRMPRPAAGYYFRLKLDKRNDKAPDFTIANLLPAPHEGHRETLSERTTWDYEAQRQDFLKADETEKLRMEVDHLRATDEAVMSSIDLILKYESKR